MNLIDGPDLDVKEVAETLFLIANGSSRETLLKYKLNIDSLKNFFKFIESAEEITEKEKCMPAFTIPHPSRNATIDNRNFAFSAPFT